MVTRNGFALFGATGEYATAMRDAGLDVTGTLGDLIAKTDVVVDCTPKRIAAKNVPEPEIPSHQGPDAQTVDPELDVVTMAVRVPETLAHPHYWAVQMTRRASKDEVLDAFSRIDRIALIRIKGGLVALNTVKELYAYMVDNQAIVIPETIDAIRALTGTVQDAATSITRTNAALGIEAALV